MTMTRPFIRPIRQDDFDDILQLANQAGGGMTNLPADEKALKSIIDLAVSSFSSNATQPGPERYLMVLDLDGRAMGTSAVFSSIGLDSGFVNYKVNYTFHASEKLNKRTRRRTLIPTHDFTGAGEVASLFLSKEARGGGHGKFLAKSRYLFIAQSSALIADPICAELRGWRDPKGAQPFWESLGKKFFDMDFEEADIHNAANGNQFIADLMPRHPIYTCMLSEPARECIGRPHDGSIPAYEMLIAEGFEYKNYVDIFDAGPLLEAKKENIKSIRESRLYKIDQIEENIAGKEFLLASGAIESFKCVRSSVRLAGDTLALEAPAARVLGVNIGDEIRGVSW